jgi:hypothetical protein
LLTITLNKRLKGQHVPTEATEASMKDVATAILASLFVLISLISLISADPRPSGARWVSVNAPGHAAELEIRYALHK